VYEGRCRAVAEALLDPARSPEFLADLEGFVDYTAAPARANMLAQVALRYTAPGVPDLYQGTELPDFSLVDPDNRRPVDFGLRERLLARAPGTPGREKLSLIAELLGLRRGYPALFAAGDYRPVRVEGKRSDHVPAFTRSAEGATLLCVVALHCGQALAGTASAAPPAEWWGDTTLNLASGATAFPSRLAALLATGPVYASVEAGSVV
jgi:(1->4)-alpha-D-glucan 1-alpha-D-glucosylmutase